MGKDFEQIVPPRIRALPRTAGGFPVPFFVDRMPGQPIDFRIMSPAALEAAIQRRLCWICGQPLGRYRAFVGGPLMAGQRMSAEPPSHTDCAEYAAHACPFLANPEARRSMVPTPAAAPLPGLQVEENPEVAAVCVVQDHEVIRTPGGPMFRMADPVRVHWYHRGLPATRAQVEAAIGTARTRFFSRATGREAEDRFRTIEARILESMPAA